MPRFGSANNFGLDEASGFQAIGSEDLRSLLHAQLVRTYGQTIARRDQTCGGSIHPRCGDWPWRGGAACCDQSWHHGENHCHRHIAANAGPCQGATCPTNRSGSDLVRRVARCTALRLAACTRRSAMPESTAVFPTPTQQPAHRAREGFRASRALVRCHAALPLGCDRIPTNAMSQRAARTQR